MKRAFKCWVFVLCAADKVHYLNGRGIVQHTFDAEVAEELSVYAGEEVGVASLGVNTDLFSRTGSTSSKGHMRFLEVPSAESSSTFMCT